MPLTPITHVAAFTSLTTAAATGRKAALLLFFVAVMLGVDASAIRAQSGLDSFDPNADGPVRVVVVQPDGKILIGGDFTTLSPNGGAAVTRNYIARLNADGTLDAAFDPNADGPVHSMAVQADGKILAGGFFSSIGGQARNNIARLDATSGLADSFDPNASDPTGNNAVFSLALQADGKILVGGLFTTIGGQSRRAIARLDATTGLADSFDPDPSGVGYPNANNVRVLGFSKPAEVDSIVVQADGKILVAGVFSGIGGQPRTFIARLDPTTGLADSFDPNPNNQGTPFGSVRSIAVQQADGKILAGGNFTTIGEHMRNHIARLDATTGLADSFDPNANDTVWSIAVQADGKVLAGGDFTTLAPNGGATVARNHIARLQTVGSLPSPTPTPTPHATATPHPPHVTPTPRPHVTPTPTPTPTPHAPHPTPTPTPHPQHVSPTPTPMQPQGQSKL